MTNENEMMRMTDEYRVKMGRMLQGHSDGPNIREQMMRNMPPQRPLPPLSYNGQLPGIATVQPFGTRQHIHPDGQAQRLEPYQTPGWPGTAPHE
jgi:hypothetical protein